jgi:hypothetical protein
MQAHRQQELVDGVHVRSPGAEKVARTRVCRHCQLLTCSQGLAQLQAAQVQAHRQQELVDGVHVRSPGAEKVARTRVCRHCKLLTCLQGLAQLQAVRVCRNPRRSSACYETKQDRQRDARGQAALIRPRQQDKQSKRRTEARVK